MPTSTSTSDLAALAEKIAAAVPGAASEIAVGELTVSVDAARILDVLKYLQGEGEFKILVDVCGLDWPQRAKRFDVVYHLLSMTKNARVRIKAQVGEGESIATVADIYPTAGWFERETFDMYGVPFAQHPDM